MVRALLANRVNVAIRLASHRATKKLGEETRTFTKGGWKVKMAVVA